MTIPGGQKPAPTQSGGSAGGRTPKPGRAGLATTETFGRFIRNLARLEGGAATGKGRKGKGGGR